MYTVIGLLFVAVAFAEVGSSHRGHSSSSSSSETHKTVLVEYPADHRQEPWQHYDDLSSSELSPIRNEPYYVARKHGKKIHQFFRKTLNMTRVLCDKGPTEAYDNFCKATICASLSDLGVGELADHVDISGCRAFTKLPSTSEAQNACGPIPEGRDAEEFCEVQFWKVKNEGFLSRFLKNVATEAKNLCYHTEHFVDDRCKAKVECLTIETLSVSWPDLFAQKNCTQQDLETREQMQSIREHDRKLRAQAKL